MQFRHEYKHNLNYADYLFLRPRLQAVMRPDEHVSEQGYYHIRSLYFDNASDKVLMEKINGISDREKFRIRCYDFNFDFIRLEKKVKRGNLGYKAFLPLTREETRSILDGDVEWMKNRKEALSVEFYEKMKLQGLRPKTIVDYRREPYVYSAGNVRVTLDYDIRTGALETDMLDRGTVTVPVCPGMVVLEVKYDNFLPDVVRDAVQLKFRNEVEFSKYGACRKFG